MKKSKVIVVLILITSFVAIGFLLILSTRPYLTVAQVLENPSNYNNQEIEVIGIVQDYSSGNFNLTEGSYKIVIETSGITIPDDFSNGIQVVVRGVFVLSSILNANQILTQCS